MIFNINSTRGQTRFLTCVDPRSYTNQTDGQFYARINDGLLCTRVKQYLTLTYSTDIPYNQYAYNVLCIFSLTETPASLASG